MRPVITAAIPRDTHTLTCDIPALYGQATLSSHHAEHNIVLMPKPSMLILGARALSAVLVTQQSFEQTYNSSCVFDVASRAEALASLPFTSLVLETSRSTMHAFQLMC